MMEHAPWRGDEYREGGLMLWGFSHHREPDEDDASTFTHEVVEEHALDGSHWYFDRIRVVCGGDAAEAFWQSVAFANTLPDAVVGDIYSAGSPEARLAVKPRVTRLLAEFRPRRAILFSRKGWGLWPELNGSYPEPSRSLASAPMVRWGTYDIGAPWEVLAYNLPHPQFQRVSELAASVAAIMRHEP